MRKLSEVQKRTLQLVKAREVRRVWVDNFMPALVFGAGQRTVEALVKRHLIMEPPVSWMQPMNYYTVTGLGQNVLDDMEVTA